MINKKTDVCKWHQCNIGYRYHHTGEQWDTHQQYSKTDIPKFIQPTEVVDIQGNQVRAGAMPAGYEPQVKCLNSKTMFWRGLSLGALIITWTVIIVTVLR